MTRPVARRAVIVITMLALLAAGCGERGATPATPAVTLPPAPVTTAPATQAPAGSTAPTTATSSTPAAPSDSSHPDLAGAATAVTLRELAGGLQQPLWATAQAPGDGRLYVAEQPGRIRVIDNGTLSPTPLLDITDRVASGGERGLLGFAFPPDVGPAHPVVFVHYSNRDGDTTLSAFTFDPHDAGRLDPASERILLTVKQPYPNHNGGWVGFDRDGMLLLALGDGGSGGDPENRASNTSELLGKILRLDVSAAAGSAPYAIPADNPFASGQGGRPEILHYGLRNPFRASVDPATGNLWIGDVGQNAWEEIDIAPAGARGLDFGWRRWEGLHCYNPSSGCDPTGVTMPVLEYDHGEGCSVIGGVVYHGTAIPQLRGAYLYSDYCSGTLWGIDAAAAAARMPVTPVALLQTGRQVSSIGTDGSGEIVLTDLGGSVLRLVPAG